MVPLTVLPASKSGHSADAAVLDWVLSIVYGVARPPCAARFADTVVSGGESPTLSFAVSCR